MAESNIAEWSADISAKPYSERVYHFSSAIARQTLFRLLDIRTCLLYTSDAADE